MYNEKKTILKHRPFHSKQPLKFLSICFYLECSVMSIESFIINGHFLALLVPSYKYWKLSHIKLECTMKEKPILKHRPLS